MKLTFWGATRQVTGSMMLLETEDFTILIDCGFDFDTNEKEQKRRFKDQTSLFPFDPTLVNVVLLTHAHIDHSGNIPNLYKAGFEGQVICTEPTLELSALLLRDAANLFQRKKKNAEERISKKKARFMEGYYDEKEVRQALTNFVPVAFGRNYRLADHVRLQFIEAGHLLGAAHILLEIWEDNEKKTICFSGDIGRRNYPLLNDPAPVPEVDYLVCEATYGNRRHQSAKHYEQEVLGVVREACVDKPGRLIIPAFSVGRTQALLYVLNRLAIAGQLPPIKVFADSPLARAASRIYQRHLRWLNREAREFHEENATLFDFEKLIYLESNDASKAVSNHAEPCIIISSSGMVQGGRVKHHIAANIQNPYATVLFVGYASEGTLGKKLLDGLDSLMIDDEPVKVLAKIQNIDVFSGHADYDDLIEFVTKQDPDAIKKVFLVHGQPESMEMMSRGLGDLGYIVESPERGATFEL